MLTILAFSLTVLFAILDAENLSSTDRKTKIKAYVKLGLLIAAALMQAYKEHEDSTDKINSANAERQRDSTNAANYQSELKKYSKEHADSLKSYSIFIDTLLAKYGLKVDSLDGAIKTIKTNHEEPHIALLAGKGAGFKGWINGDKFSIKGMVINDGKSPAYGLHLETRLLFVFNDSLYRFKWLPDRNTDDHDIVPQRMTPVESEMFISDALYRGVTDFILVITGFYYIESGRTVKSKRNVRLVVDFDPKEKECYISGNSVDTLLKNAKLATFLYKKP